MNKSLPPPIELGVITFHPNAALRERFYAVVDDLCESGPIVDVWLMDIASVLREHGYIMEIRPASLECPCCGDDGATANAAGDFVDGQPLECGCPGWVSVDEDDGAWINNGDEPCIQCEREEGQ